MYPVTKSLLITKTLYALGHHTNTDTGEVTSSHLWPWRSRVQSQNIQFLVLIHPTRCPSSKEKFHGVASQAELQAQWPSFISAFGQWLHDTTSFPVEMARRTSRRRRKTSRRRKAWLAIGRRRVPWTWSVWPLLPCISSTLCNTSNDQLIYTADILVQIIITFSSNTFSFFICVFTPLS